MLMRTISECRRKTFLLHPNIHSLITLGVPPISGTFLRRSHLAPCPRRTVPHHLPSNWGGNRAGGDTDLITIVLGAARAGPRPSRAGRRAAARRRGTVMRRDCRLSRSNRYDERVQSTM